MREVYRLDCEADDYSEKKHAKQQAFIQEFMCRDQDWSELKPELFEGVLSGGLRDMQSRWGRIGQVVFRLAREAYEEETGEEWDS